MKIPVNQHTLSLLVSLPSRKNIHYILFFLQGVLININKVEKKTFKKNVKVVFFLKTYDKLFCLGGKQVETFGGHN